MYKIAQVFEVLFAGRVEDVDGFVTVTLQKFRHGVHVEFAAEDAMEQDNDFRVLLGHIFLN
jgi:hypothetical protein